MIFKSKVADIQIPETDLTSVVHARVDELGEKPALIDGPTGRTISYLELRALTEKMSKDFICEALARAMCSPHLCPTCLNTR